jgi:hypothetical protein
MDSPVNSPMDTGAPPAFAGDLLLRLASEGMLVMAPEHADPLIAELTLTLEVVRARCGLLRLLQHSRNTPEESSWHLDQTLVDVAFAEQTSPGRLTQALSELPKYIRAFEIAKAGQQGPPR